MQILSRRHAASAHIYLLGDGQSAYWLAPWPYSQRHQFRGANVYANNKKIAQIQQQMNTHVKYYYIHVVAKIWGGGGLATVPPPPPALSTFFISVDHVCSVYAFVGTTFTCLCACCMLHNVH